MSDLVVNEPDRVLLREPLGGEIVMDVAWSKTEGIEEFNELFEIDPTDYIASTDYYQGMDFTRVIKRKSDGRLFGFQFWDSPGNDGMEAQYDSNAEGQGLKVEWDDEVDGITTNGVPGQVWVFLPVEPFVINSYRVVKA